jgi:hypothetical protein
MWRSTVRVMRIRLCVGLVLLALLAACGGDDDDDGDGGAASGSEDTVSVSEPDEADEAASGGDVDCDAIESSRDLLVGVQVLAQIRSQDQVDLIKEGTLAFDPDAFIAAMEEFRALGGVDDAVDVYVDAAGEAKVILANDGPVPQEDFDALEAITGPIDEVGSFLAHQATIGAAFSEACG